MNKKKGETSARPNRAGTRSFGHHNSSGAFRVVRNSKSRQLRVPDLNLSWANGRPSASRGQSERRCGGTQAPQALSVPAYLGLPTYSQIQLTFRGIKLWVRQHTWTL